MERDELQELHYIAPIENMESILNHGILSHVKASPISHVSVAMQEIQDKRIGKIVPQGLRLHDYANLYFHARNPMLYVILNKRWATISELCVLSISSEVLDLEGVIIATCNASSKYCAFYPASSGLKYIDAVKTFAENWTDADQIESWRKKASKCAEVLVPNIIDPKYITGAYVGNEAAKQRLKELAPGLPVTHNIHMFFL